MKKRMKRILHLFEWYILLWLVSLQHIQYANSANNADLTSLDGHLKRFGEGRPSHPIEEIDGFPMVEDFFHNFVFKSLPVKMKGAAKLSPAYSKWEDDYFLSLEVPAGSAEVVVETKKKEDRKRPPVMLGFKDFVSIYNQTDQYMVNNVPDFLRHDVLLPGPLQCDQIYENSLVENIMWFSSGGTKSVVHTDSVDNIICVYRGEKQFIMVDPHKYADQVEIDNKEGAYSEMDVDSVDYTKYPGMAEVEFHHVNLSAGDCLYIPYKWIHQVRSEGRNVAVNIWWDNYKNRQLDPVSCPRQLDPHLTLDKLEFGGFSSTQGETMQLRELLLEETDPDPIFFEHFRDMMTSDLNLEAMNAGGGYVLTLKEMFDSLDMTGDGKVSNYEVKSVKQQNWDKIEKLLSDFGHLVAAIEEDYHRKEEEEEFTRDEL